MKHYSTSYKKNSRKISEPVWVFLFVCMYGLVIIACVSPIGQSEKNDQNINSKETRRGEGAEYSTYFQNVFEKLCFTCICEIFFIF